MSNRKSFAFRLNKYMLRYSYTREEAIAHIERLDTQYAANARNDARHAAEAEASTLTIRGNQSIADAIAAVTYSVISRINTPNYVPIGPSLYERRFQRSEARRIEYKLDPKTRRWIEISNNPTDD